MRKFRFAALPALALATGLGFAAMTPAQARGLQGDMGTAQTVNDYGPRYGQPYTYAPRPDGYPGQPPAYYQYRDPAADGMAPGDDGYGYESHPNYGGPSHESPLLGSPCYYDTLNGRVCI